MTTSVQPSGLMAAADECKTQSNLNSAAVEPVAEVDAGDWSDEKLPETVGNQSDCLLGTFFLRLIKYETNVLLLTVR